MQYIKNSVTALIDKPNNKIIPENFSESINVILRLFTMKHISSREMHLLPVFLYN